MYKRTKKDNFTKFSIKKIYDFIMKINIDLNVNKQKLILRMKTKRMCAYDSYTLPARCEREYSSL